MFKDAFEPNQELSKKFYNLYTKTYDG